MRIAGEESCKIPAGKIWVPLILSLVASVFCLISAAPAQHADQWQERFIKEAPRGWKEYSAFAERLQGQLSVTWTKNGSPYMRFSVSVKQNPTCKLYEWQSFLSQGKPNGASKGLVRGYNPRYVFALARKSPKSAWVLTDINVGADRNTSELAEYALNATGWVSSLVQFRGRSLATLMQQPAFRLLKAEPVMQDGVEMVRVEFDNPHPWQEEGKPFYPIQGGTLILDPNHYWCLRQADVRCLYSGATSTEHQEAEYGDSKNGYLIPRRAVERVENTDLSGKRVSQLVIETTYELEEASVLPGDQEFTTLAYGIPEPFDVQAAAQKPRWYLWLGVAGGVLLLLGVLVRRLKLRAARVAS